MRRLALALPALLLAGCYDAACDPQYCFDPSEITDNWVQSNLRSTLTLDPSLSEAELGAVFAAGDAWGEATNGEVDIKFVMGEEGSLPAHYVVRRAREGGLRPGELAATGTTIMILGDGLGENQHLRPVLLHEFGHYLGLGHEPDLPEDIMYPYTHEGMPSAPTADAVSDLRKLYELP